MATQYGVQFEALMAEVCRDFGAKLIKSWEADSGSPLDKAEVRDFVDEAVKNFFKTHVSSPEVEAEPVKKKGKGKGKAPALDVEVEIAPAKGKAPAKKGKKKAEPEPESEPDIDLPVYEAPAKGKKKAPAKKPKCQAVTAKGTPCSKCAAEGEPFCSVHLKKAPATVEKKPTKETIKAKGGKGGKGLAKASPPKHTHSLTSPPLKENPCELCETHGMPFEVPEYEEDKPEDIAADPDFVLGEEDFEEESEDESDFDELD